MSTWWIQYKQQLMLGVGGVGASLSVEVYSKSTFWPFLHYWNPFEAGGKRKMCCGTSSRMQTPDIVTSDQKKWQLQEDKTQQLRLAEYGKKKNPINRELSGRQFKGNLPEEEASCLLLKRVRVQGFKGLWRRLTMSGQGQLLSALVLGVGQGLTCKWWEWQ